ncbi:hypothetical protein VCRA2110O318_40059 [Vibrio crassostreae]|nr:hypothetical protein VCRA2117O328_40058 [Vibrio crassostreae]CAK2335422.1 hypothetical protein VCRA2110O318_40059 [Vibrio crassostreae]CAK2503881.1 hypothetical protein VCRA2110O319_50059 [Vibrio crassostreae]CAK2909662.1 hypothetical protein VCRA217O317_30234 [Vibrio crassostreae]
MKKTSLQGMSGHATYRSNIESGSPVTLAPATEVGLPMGDSLSVIREQERPAYQHNPYITINAQNEALLNFDKPQGIGTLIVGFRQQATGTEPVSLQVSIATVGTNNEIQLNKKETTTVRGGVNLEGNMMFDFPLALSALLDGAAINISNQDAAASVDIWEVTVTVIQNTL